MITNPTTHPADASVGSVRTAFLDDHLHLILLTDAGTLLGTLTRDDLPDRSDDAPALSHAHLDQRTITADGLIDVVYDRLIATGHRRLAVVTRDDGRLLGLICLKRDHTGFCSDADVRARKQDPQRVHQRA